MCVAHLYIIASHLGYFNTATEFALLCRCARSALGNPETLVSKEKRTLNLRPRANTAMFQLALLLLLAGTFVALTNAEKKEFRKDEAERDAYMKDVETKVEKRQYYGGNYSNSYGGGYGGSYGGGYGNSNASSYDNNYGSNYGNDYSSSSPTYLYSSSYYSSPYRSSFRYSSNYHYSSRYSSATNRYSSRYSSATNRYSSRYSSNTNRYSSRYSSAPNRYSSPNNRYSSRYSSAPYRYSSSYSSRYSSPNNRYSSRYSSPNYPNSYSYGYSSNNLYGSPSNPRENVYTSYSNQTLTYSKCTDPNSNDIKKWLLKGSTYNRVVSTRLYLELLPACTV